MPVSDPFKVIVVGDSGVGKSTIIAAHLGERFNPCFVQTKERVINRTLVNVNGKKVNLQIWDTPGADQCRTMCAAYMRQDIKGVIVVFDVTNEDSYFNVQHWMRTVREYSGEDSISVVIVGNKIDKPNRKVQEESGHQLAGQYSAVEYIETSAKPNQDHRISDVFQSIAQTILNKQQRPVSPSYSSVDDDDDDDSNRKRGFSCVLL